MKDTIKKIAYIAMGVILTGTIAIASVAMASEQSYGTTANGQTTANESFHKLSRGPGMGRPGMMGGIVGKITAISGNTITVLGNNNKTYTVDATSATVMVDGATSTLNKLANGDQIMVKGTPNTTDTTKITAKLIAKGTPPALTGTRYQILGQVTAISGTTLTVKDSNGTSFTVDAAKANVVVNGAKSTIANLAVNDEVMVNGLAKDSTTTQVTARLILKGTEKVDLSTLKNLRDKEERGFEMGMGRGMGMGMGGFEPQEQAETTQQ